MSTSTKTYHHGDLRTALLTAAVESLEEGERFSLRAVARRAGVSPAAPYRHFADREALESAIAVDGFQTLRRDLETALGTLPGTSTPAQVMTAMALAYVGFALRHPAVFRLMFGRECDPADDARVRASDALHDTLGDQLERLFPSPSSPGLPTALWSTAHGLAFLHLDGKLRPADPADVETRVRDAVSALFGLGKGPS
ncbi:TetR/AcrR family transcriptional regulator [Microbacterium resistens]|uniref:TetR/AcrR family transcriptional regulator n=1 Tax=Microbacterium resistens TaxID=156977 RepID=UPI00082FABC9|nr:TetR/AcrR family transcriptional regulator [Microbacterium resistens]